MPKYRKKPIVVEVEQFTDSGPDPDGVYRDDKKGPYVITVNQQVCFIEAGDFIVPQDGGVHFYPCKPKDFELLYDAV